MINLATIETQTQHYAQAREALSQRLASLEEAIHTAKRMHMAGIKQAVRQTKQAQATLSQSIDDGAHLFQKPRTLVIHGVRVGIQKGKGQIVIDNPEQTVRLIRKHLPDSSDTLIKATETPIKKALANLTVAQLKKIGVQLQQSGDAIIIKPTDSQVEKLVTQLLAEEEERNPTQATVA